MNIYYTIKLYIKKLNKVYLNIIEKINMNFLDLKYKTHHMIQQKIMIIYNVVEHINGID